MGQLGIYFTYLPIWLAIVSEIDYFIILLCIKYIGTNIPRYYL